MIGGVASIATALVISGLLLQGRGPGPRVSTGGVENAELIRLLAELPREDRRVLDEIADPDERLFEAQVLSFRQHPSGDMSELAPFIQSLESVIVLTPGTPGTTEHFVSTGRAVQSMAVLSQAWVLFGPLDSAKDRIEAGASRCVDDQDEVTRLFAALLLKTIDDGPPPGGLSPAGRRALDAILSNASVAFELPKQLEVRDNAVRTGRQLLAEQQGR